MALTGKEKNIVDMERANNELWAEFLDHFASDPMSYGKFSAEIHSAIKYIEKIFPIATNLMAICFAKVVTEAARRCILPEQNVDFNDIERT